MKPGTPGRPCTHQDRRIPHTAEDYSNDLVTDRSVGCPFRRQSLLMAHSDPLGNGGWDEGRNCATFLLEVRSLIISSL